MKKLIFPFLAALLLLTGMTQIHAANIPFRDVEESAWYADAVEAVYSKGIMEGKAEDTFDPKGL